MAVTHTLVFGKKFKSPTGKEGVEWCEIGYLSQTKTGTFVGKIKAVPINWDGTFICKDRTVPKDSGEQDDGFEH